MIATQQPPPAMIPRVTQNLLLDLQRKSWVLQNFRRARAAEPTLTQAESAFALTLEFRKAGLIGENEVVPPGVLQRWEAGTSAPAGRRLDAVVGWMERRLKEASPQRAVKPKTAR